MTFCNGRWAKQNRGVGIQMAGDTGMKLGRCIRCIKDIIGQNKWKGTEVTWIFHSKESHCEARQKKNYLVTWKVGNRRNIAQGDNEYIKNQRTWYATNMRDSQLSNCNVPSVSHLDSHGSQIPWFLDPMVLGSHGYWIPWFLDPMVIGSHGNWTPW